MLLANGYRLVDSTASKGPGGDATAVAFISANATGLFQKDAYYNQPFVNGSKDGSLTPEQAALPGAVANPTAGLAFAGALTGGLVAAAAAPQIAAGADAVATYTIDLFASYKAAQAGYSLTTAALTGAGVSGGIYTGSALLSAGRDWFSNDANFKTSFDQKFSTVGLGTAATFGAFNGMFTASMFGWAGVANSIKNASTIPGFMIRANGIALGQTAGRAAQAIVNQDNQPKH